MTSGVAHAAQPRAGTRTGMPLAVAVVAAGCTALSVRPNSGPAFAVTVAVGIAGMLHPAVRSGRRDAFAWTGCVALGIGAFALVRWTLGGSALAQPTTSLLAMAIAAGVAEEAFFRRLVYATCARWGASAAVACSSFAFAIVHVTMWGWRAFPLDLAAGVLLGWQRWVTGSWTAPAATHAAANLLMLL